MSVSGSPHESPTRPAWVPEDLYPFADDYVELNGSRVHYVDEGSGPTLLLLHGNPTWSFLYREIIKALADSFRCIALDLPGFGLSHAAPGFAFTPAEHADVVEQLVLQLDLSGVTMMVQDWGGPVGFATATRHPERFVAFVIGNTWAWPKSDPGTQLFSRILGGPLGAYLIQRRNFFIENILANNVKLRKLSDARDGRLPRAVPDPRIAPPDARVPARDPGKQALPGGDRARPPGARRPPGAARLADEGHRLPRARAQALGEVFPITTRSCSRVPGTTFRRPPLRRSSSPSASGRRASPDADRES